MYCYSNNAKWGQVPLCVSMGHMIVHSSSGAHQNDVGWVLCRKRREFARAVHTMRHIEKGGYFVLPSWRANSNQLNFIQHVEGTKFCSHNGTFSQKRHVTRTKLYVGATCSLGWATVSHIWPITTSANKAVNQSEFEKRTTHAKRGKTVKRLIGWKQQFASDKLENHVFTS